MKCHALIGPTSVGASRWYNSITEACESFQKYLSQADYYGLADTSIAYMDVETAHHAYRYTKGKRGALHRQRLDFSPFD